MDQFEKELISATPQGSEQWIDLRAGRFTASEFWRLVTEPRTKAAKEAGEWSQTAMTYIKEKVAETLTGQPKTESYAYPLVYGKELEPQAREYFESKTGLIVSHCGFQVYTDHAGGSPDGLIGEDMGLEIKCPFNSANQIDYLSLKAENFLDEYPEYFWQVQCNLKFTDRKLWYFVTYDPRFKKEEHKMKILKITPDAIAFAVIEEKLIKAIETKLQIISNL
ncbi:MAG: YqaJ viral recombinase family protein [Patescibacteria group bacterium]|nr:YqaJ viral recombinase family protein [Patescibacteria group bacterium]